MRRFPRVEIKPIALALLPATPFVVFLLVDLVIPFDTWWYKAIFALPLIAISIQLHKFSLRSRLRANEASVSARNDSPTSSCDELVQLNVEVVPIWAKQIETVRVDSEKAVTGLANQFGGISRRIFETIRASVEFSNEGVKTIEKESTERSDMITQDELAEILDTLRDAIDVKQILLEKIEALKEQTLTMKEVISSVKRIANKTNILALNASIESARAGEFGKTFAVVAQEVRKLSELSGSTVDDVVSQINALSARMDEVIAQTRQNTGTHEKQGANNLATNSTSVYERFKHLALSLSKSSEVLLHESRNIKVEIDGILVDLQYQDRTSQMLNHVIDNMKEMVSQLEGNGEVNREDVLNKLKKSYTMIEEVKNHGGDAVLETKIEDSSSAMFFF